nr:ABC transporter ATP-binding protein [Verrucomicrobium spinosum]
MNSFGDHPVRLERLVKIYAQGLRQIHALQQVDLTVKSGEFVAIMGASGSGKSTLLHAIAGLTDVNEGKVIVAGQDLAAFSDAALTRFRRKQVGMVFQAFNLIPSLTAEENIQLPAMELPDVKQRAEAIMTRMGLLDRRHHRPDALSGGEQQRVAIGRALMMEPAILLADEPREVSTPAPAGALPGAE